MALSTKKQTKAGQVLAKKIKDKATRVAFLSDDEMRQLKIISITKNIGVKDLIDASLEKIISCQNYKFKAIDVNAKKRSFVIEQERLQEMKIFLVGYDGVTQDKLIYNAVLEII